MTRARPLVLALLCVLGLPGTAGASPWKQAHPALLKPSKLVATKPAAGTQGAKPGRKIALVIGTFDPFHEDHFALAAQARKEGAKEVLLVPGWNPKHKPNVTRIDHRMKMIVARIRRERGINLYQADASEHLSKGQDAFIEHVKQLYGTDDVTIHIGQDAFEEGFDKYGVSPTIGYKYRVTPRGDGAATKIPDALKDKITFATKAVPGGHSSTEVRERIKAGKSVKGMVDRKVERYIRMNHLYE